MPAWSTAQLAPLLACPAAWTASVWMLLLVCTHITVRCCLTHGVLPCSQYRYFVWLNSSVRGPFLPAYLRGKMHWTAAFTSRITDSVKLVGSTINCG